MKGKLTRTVTRTLTLQEPCPLVIDEVYTGEDIVEYVSALTSSCADRVWFKRRDGDAWRYSYVKVDDFRGLLIDHGMLWPLPPTRAKRARLFFYRMESGSGINVKRLPWWSD